MNSEKISESRSDVFDESIATRQTLPEMVALLRARERSYRLAKWIQGILVTISVALPIMGLATADLHQAVKPAIAFIALALLLFDVGFLDPISKRLVKQGAIIQEQFDTEVFKLPWNESVVGEPVSPETVRRASKSPLSKAREAQLSQWYEPCSAEVPVEVGRIICQRTNLSYDSRLRHAYATWVLIAAITLGFALLAVALARDLSFQTLVLSLAVPVTPLLAWALRERRKQLDSVAGLFRAQSECNKLWELALGGAIAADLTAGSRILQDAIFLHRSSSPLVFDWAYSLLRNSNEDAASHAARVLTSTWKKHRGISQ